MFNNYPNRLVLIASAIFASFLFNSGAAAGTCGGAAPCFCGDTVTSNKNLSGADPIVGDKCPVNGLEVAAGVTLDLKGNTIQGLENGIGIVINGDGATIKNGKVESFGTGISGVTNDSTIQNVRTYFHIGDGLFLQGNENEVTGSPARHNGDNGYWIVGDGNTIEATNNEYNGLDGIFVDGNGNFVLNNQASENSKTLGAGLSGNGITVVGNGNTLHGNRISKKNDFGIFVDGDNNIVTSNFATKSNKGGIKTVGHNNRLTNNKATENHGGVGILAEGSTDAANFNASTNNVVHGNPCNIYTFTGPPQCIKK